MLAVIIGCEIAFWVFVAAGLVLRYPARRPRAGGVVLACAPLTDLALLVVAAISVHLGAVADWSYGLAAVYLGVSVIFGRDLIAAADRKVRRAPRTAAVAMTARAAWRLWLRAAAAGAICALLLVCCLLLARDSAQTEPFRGWFANIGLVLAAWLVHPLSRSVRNR